MLNAKLIELSILIFPTSDEGGEGGKEGGWGDRWCFPLLMIAFAGNLPVNETKLYKFRPINSAGECGGWGRQGTVPCFDSFVIRLYFFLYLSSTLKGLNQEI
jgi:hypothetical protein